MLHMAHNPFEHLPESLARIPNLKIDHPKRALLEDVSYRSDNPDPTNETLFSLAPALQASLAGAVAANSDDPNERTFIKEEARLTVFAIPCDARQEPAPGLSKISGVPDLPTDLADPIDDRGLLYRFHAQLVDLAVFGTAAIFSAARRNALFLRE